MWALNLIQDRFRGSLIGVLVGDCLGAPFERGGVNPSTLLEEIEKLSKTKLKYTDDTAMTISTCKSLLDRFNPKRLAKEYTESYFKEPYRGYGASVRQVFALLRNSKYEDPYGPAKDQFDGSGSYGNGAAMRCNGIALYAYKNKLNQRQTLDLVDNCSKITHSHPYGVHGASLLVLALEYVLNLREDRLEDSEFIDHLIISMSDLEDCDNHIFTDKLRIIKRVIEQLAISGTDVSQKEIVDLLGNDVSAQNSVPLAIYSFLRGASKFTDRYRIENEFLRTLHWAISCDGDTDTIASMACGLAGAYFGLRKIPEHLYKNCEAYEEMLSLADKLSLNFTIK